MMLGYDFTTYAISMVITWAIKVELCDLIFCKSEKIVLIVTLPCCVTSFCRSFSFVAGARLSNSKGASQKNGCLFLTNTTFSSFPLSGNNL
jgi:hypothetical protein